MCDDYVEPFWMDDFEQLNQNEADDYRPDFDYDIECDDCDDEADTEEYIPEE